VASNLFDEQLQEVVPLQSLVNVALTPSPFKLNFKFKAARPKAVPGKPATTTASTDPFPATEGFALGFCF
jgi:hypothetical protein